MSELSDMMGRGPTGPTPNPSKAPKVQVIESEGGYPGREGPGGEQPSERGRTTEWGRGLKTAYLSGLVWALSFFVSEVVLFFMSGSKQGLHLQYSTGSAALAQARNEPSK